MELSFLGGAREVGRSAVMCESDGLRLLYDCGVKTEREYKFPLLDKVKRPHAIALTHAHLDHSGYLPAIFRHESLPVLCTFPTIPLVDLLLEDTLKLAQEEQKQAYFAHADLRKMQRHAVAMPYGKDYGFFNGDSMMFLDAGHILGSAQILHRTRSGNVLYTGDFNGVQTVMHNAAQVPKEKVRVLITESTYGAQEHPDRKELVKKFVREVKDSIDDGMAVLLPCFAVGRTQEMIQVLYENGLADRVHLDGMGRKTSEVALGFPSYIRDYETFEKAYSRVRMVQDNSERKHAAKAGNIIVTTAGMMEGGPVLNYLERFTKANVRAKVFVTGYQVKGTNGRRLLEEGKFRSHGHMMSFPGEVSFYDFSAHSGKKELIRHAKACNPEKVFCVHGDPEKIELFVDVLRNEGFDAAAPKLGDRITI